MNIHMIEGAKPALQRLAAVLFGVTALLVLVAPPASAWYFDSIYYYGQSSEFSDPDEGSYSATTTNSSGHDGISVRHGWKASGAWHSTSTGYGYSTTYVGRSQYSDNATECLGYHRVKVGSWWSEEKNSIC